MLKKFTTTTFISLVALTSLCVSFAQARTFDVELILFKRNDPQPTGEYWDQSQQQLSITPTQQLLAPLLKCSPDNCDLPQQLPVEINGSGWPVQGPIRVQMLPASQFGLNQQWNVIRHHAAFTPLLHMLWRENIPSRARSTYLGIEAGKQLPIIQTTDNQQPQWELQGGLRIYLQHYLYIDSQLLLTEQQPLQPSLSAPNQENTSTPSDSSSEGNAAITSNTAAPNEDTSLPQMQFVSYKFDQKRRVRSGEIHYFDHPKLGMIIQIRKIPETEPNGQNSDE
ncbi:peptidoglycan binding protein CsiV [Celerinatantimonas sp. YJH-8]|uniref:peptidoglycan binding protein CsiV n=1 Tax=Celerinatantimonas sp. YJH-8 TaxID=3228714 RepID=UPI0038C5A55F